MAGSPERECNLGNLVEATLVAGSDYRGVYRKGARVALQLEEATGRVIVTRGSGAVKLAYLIGPHAETIAYCLGQGYRYSGHVADVAIGPGGKVLRLQLDPPTR